MLGITVNPASVRDGGRIATKSRPITDDHHEIIKSRVVKRVQWCDSKPECVHLDHECYDTRFSTVIVPA